MISGYYDQEVVRKEVQRGRHRELVGGLWEELGLLQRDFLIAQGLRPDMHLLDIGCGCLRAGVHLVDYLQARHYYGVDLSADLIDAGYDIELEAQGLQDKLPRESLVCDAGFRFDRFGREFDVALAQSLFTHLPLNQIKLCLTRLARVMSREARLFATFFICQEGHPWDEPLHHETGGVTSFPAQDPYHYRLSDIEYAAADLPWKLSGPYEWDHPRDQLMMILEKTD